MRKIAFTLAITLATLALAGCEKQETAPSEAPQATGLTRLPISTNAAMVGLVDHSADYIWAVGNGDLPQNDHDWDLVRSAVYDMILGGAIMKVPGTGEFDQQWTADTGWQEMSDQLTEIGRDALPLVEAKSTDVEAWRAIGDRLVDNCLACHQAFKPEVPSQGVLHEGTDRESRGESIFD